MGAAPQLPLEDNGHVGHPFLGSGVRTLPADKFLVHSGLSEEVRVWVQCGTCGHVAQQFTAESLAAITALGSNYQLVDHDMAEMKRKFIEVLALPPEESDVTARGTELLQFVDRYNLGNPSNSLQWLDFGSGLGILQMRMLETSPRTVSAYLFEPDANCSAHLQEIFASHPNVKLIENLDRQGKMNFGLVSAINVLEHLMDPASALETLRKALRPKGGIFLEVPSNLNFKESPDTHSSLNSLHYRLWSQDSLSSFVNSSGFTTVFVSEAPQPSGKLSIRLHAIRD